MTGIFAKYNVPVPRYTSYPPANFFTSSFGEQDLLTAIDESNALQPQHLSFYIHFPYCKQLCYYCGCNSYIRGKHDDDEEYINAVLKEIGMVAERLSPDRKISQIHFGGGSPSSAKPSLLAKVIERLTGSFELIDHPEIAIECHPGHLTKQDYLDLISAGFNRFSLGIQDFDIEVLHAVHRVEPLLPIETVHEILTEHGIPMNLDFIYGLPCQTPESFGKTIEKAISLRPERLVTFSYAHVPAMFPQQKILEKRGLPTQEDKDDMYRRAQRLLTSAGYHQIGLDHFVLPSDELYTAAKEHTLHRNFQGYCTRRTTGQVYAFGVSAITQLASAYAQNTKVIKDYITSINAGHIPVLRGYKLNDDEQITREVITDLMCNERVTWSDVATRTDRTVDDVILATAYDPVRMQEMAQDGIIKLTDDGIEMAQKGSPFLRNVAASLDKLLIDSNKTFSKPI